MKTKYYIGILSALLLAVMPAKAQYADNDYYYNDDARIVVNNYYVDNDYYWSSRINRFHRSYAAFDYYSPVFTDIYWYSYRPYTWGISIYRGGIGFSYSYNTYYPVYYGYNYGWYDPFYYDTYYYGYSPYYYSYWYSPVVININLRNRWYGHYWGWNRYGYRHIDYRWSNHYRPVYYTHNNYYYHNSPSSRYSGRYSAPDYTARRSVSNITANHGNISRRNTVDNIPSSAGRTQTAVRQDNITRSAETRRNESTAAGRTQAIARQDNSTRSVETRRTESTVTGRTHVTGTNPVNRAGASQAPRRTGETVTATDRSHFQANSNPRTASSAATAVAPVNRNASSPVIRNIPAQSRRTVNAPVSSSAGQRSPAMSQSRSSQGRSAVSASSGRPASTQRAAVSHNSGSSNDSRSKSSASSSSGSGRRSR